MTRGVYTFGKQFVAIAVLLAAQPLIAQDQSLSLEEQEEFLRTAQIVSKRQLSDGVTRSSRATLSDGTFTHDAHIQTVDVFKTTFTSAFGTELNFRDTYKANIAAYRLDKLLGLGMITPSVESQRQSRGGSTTLS